MVLRRFFSRHAPAVETSSEPVAEPAPEEDKNTADALPYIDLGALRLPAVPGTEIRLEGDAEGRGVTGALVIDGRSGVHLVVCAAPRGEGLWQELRGELREHLSAEAEALEEVDGEFGPELRVVMPTPNGPQSLRVAGLDGDRWMLRAVFSGAAGDDLEAADLLHQVLRGAQVVRGTAPMPVRDPLPLRVPENAERVPVG